MTLPRLHRRPRRAALLLIGLFFALLLGACVNPFKPADPELPDASGVLEDFSLPESVLVTMERAIANRSANGVNAYLHAYAESTLFGDRAFRGFYDPGVKANWQSSTQLTAPEPWDISLERNVHTQISALRPTYFYVWQWGPDGDSEEDGNPAAADTVLYHRHYTLFAASPDGNITEKIAIGYADLSFQKKDGRWSIYRWNDRVDPLVGVTPAGTDERTMSWWRLESLAR